MTRAAKIMPMPFEDFAPSRPAPAAAPPAEPTNPDPRPAQAEIDAAFSAGRAAGLAEAGALHQAETAAALAGLADAVAREVARRREALEEDRQELRAALRSLVASLCRRLAAERAAPLAWSLVERMLAGSTDSAPARLFVSEETYRAFGAVLGGATERAGVALGADPALDRGECRLEWRGGAASYSHDAVSAEIDRVIAAASDDFAGERP
ncbi:MAG: hypothetical protein HXY23_07845 [Parvularculaceae bacterium]|nr:hypothetical protein [Parvularculaceae bacterium]